MGVNFYHVFQNTTSIWDGCVMFLFNLEAFSIISTDFLLLKQCSFLGLNTNIEILVILCRILNCLLSFQLGFLQLWLAYNFFFLILSLSSLVQWLYWLSKLGWEVLPCFSVLWNNLHSIRIVLWKFCENHL